MTKPEEMLPYEAEHIVSAAKAASLVLGCEMLVLVAMHATPAGLVAAVGSVGAKSDGAREAMAAALRQVADRVVAGKGVMTEAPHGEPNQ